MNRRRFIKTASGLLVPSLMGEICRGQIPVIPFYISPSNGACSAAGSTVASGWATRVVANGGAAPAAATTAALCAFVTTLMNAGVWSQMVAVNCMVADNLTALRTPLLVGPSGFDPWTQPAGSYAGGAVTINGLVGDGTHYLSTGISQQTTGITSTSAGMSIYAFATGANSVVCGCSNGAATSWIIAAHYPGFTLSLNDCWNDNDAADRASVAQNTAGFYSGSRTSNTVLKLYFATSGNAFANVGSSTGTMVGSPSAAAGSIYCMAQDVAGTSVLNISSGTCSFFAMHGGLSSGDSQTLYNAVQAMRTALGGGFL